MNISVSFHITISQMPSLQHYRMLVEHYYSSPEVERFKINGANGRFIKMEKLQTGYGGQWRVLEGGFDLKNYERTAMGIMSIQIAIDEYLEQRKELPQNDGYFDLKGK